MKPGPPRGSDDPLVGGKFAIDKDKVSKPERGNGPARRPCSLGSTRPSSQRRGGAGRELYSSWTAKALTPGVRSTGVGACAARMIRCCGGLASGFPSYRGQIIDALVTQS